MIDAAYLGYLVVNIGIDDDAPKVRFQCSADRCLIDTGLVTYQSQKHVHFIEWIKKILKNFKFSKISRLFPIFRFSIKNTDFE